MLWKLSVFLRGYLLFSNMDTLPPPPAFLSGILSFLLSFFALANNLLESENDEIPPPPLFLATVMNTFLILLPLLALFNQRNYALIGRLFPHFRGIRNHGRDVWAVLERNPHIFWYCTGETPESLETVVENIFADVTSPRHLPRVPTSNRRRRCLLDVRNRVLLGFIWLRQYLKIHVLAYIFGISKSTVAEEIYHIVPILYVRYRHYISWHGLNQWRDFLNTLPHFPNAVGAIDGTIHQVRRPSGPRQADFYRGDKKCHFMSSQMVVDADGMIVLLVAGWVLLSPFKHKFAIICGHYSNAVNVS